MVLLKRQVRASEYRRLADQASVLADGSLLENVREKHRIAAARWATLAALDEDAAVPAPIPTLGRGNLHDSHVKGL
ncbi:MAG: hypothetical protein ACJ798_19220 [Phenylobacterium sp.]